MGQLLLSKCNCVLTCPLSHPYPFDYINYTSGRVKWGEQDSYATLANLPQFKSQNLFKARALGSSLLQTTSSPPIFLRDSTACKTRARLRITPRENKRHAAWGDFHARSRFARSTIPEEKWGTTRSLQRPARKTQSSAQGLRAKKPKDSERLWLRH